MTELQGLKWEGQWSFIYEQMLMVMLNCIVQYSFDTCQTPFKKSGAMICIIIVYVYVSVSFRFQC